MNFKDLEKQATEMGSNHQDFIFNREKFAELVAAQVRARCIELVLAGSAMPIQTRTLEALQRDRKRIAALIEEDGT